MISKEFIQGFTHLFYPLLCEGCRKPLLKGEDVLCIGCLMEIPVTDYYNIPGNDTELRFAGRIPFVHATTYAYFTNEGLLQHLLHGLKYRDKKQIGTFLGMQFGYSLLEAEWISTIDMIIPVPLHAAKLAKRGFNQSLLIAEGMSKVLKIPVGEKILLRVRDTESQTKKTRAERVMNMADAFDIKNSLQLKGKHILLCDDVLTTGATLESCALALLKQENIKISVATIGIAVS